MTREEILAMTDEEKRIKAAELMGWRRLHVATEGCLSGSLVGTPQRWLTDVDMGVPNYLNDIAAAWELVEHMAENCWMELKSPFEPGQPYFAGFTPHSCTGWNGVPDNQCYGETAPRAITTAFILAMEGE